MMRSFSIILLYALLCTPFMTGADTTGGTVLIRTLIGSDEEAPSVPALQSVVPVTSYQIDITWGPATDNYTLGGYRVYRNGVILATTTQTTFSDFGLTPSTTYTYTVDAFDSFFNISATSTTVSTTTPALPPPPPPPATTTTNRSQSMASLSNMVTSFLVEPEQKSASVSFSASLPARYTVLWGRTTMYELGTVATNIYKASHQFTISGLEPGTKYFYKILATNARGQEYVVSEDSFTTAVVTTTNFPLNVQNLSAEVRATDVYLHWKNPVPMQSGAVIRVVRSHLFYPLSTTDGVVVYEGTAESYTDTGILSEYSPYFYSVFLITSDGFVSSGATVLAALEVTSSPIKQPDTGTTTPVKIAPAIPAPMGEERILRAGDVSINQGSVVVAFDALQQLEAGVLTKVVVPKSVLPAHLKTILITVFDTTYNNRSTTYLLKLSPDGLQYEATFLSPQASGQATVMMEVFDFNNQTIRRIVSGVVYVGGDTTIPASIVWMFVVPCVVIPIVLILGLLWRRLHGPK